MWSRLTGHWCTACGEGRGREEGGRGEGEREEGEDKGGEKRGRGDDEGRGKKKGSDHQQ